MKFAYTVKSQTAKNGLAFLSYVNKVFCFCIMAGYLCSGHLKRPTIYYKVLHCSILFCAIQLSINAFVSY